MMSTRFISAAVIAAVLMSSAFAFAADPAVKDANIKAVQPAEPAANPATAGPTGDLPLKDGERVVVFGDSHPGQNMWPCYMASYLVLMNPSLTLHVQNIARGGTSLRSWNDSGDANYDEYSKTVYPLQPNYVFVASSDNGGLTPEIHKTLMQKLVTEKIIGASGATPIIHGFATSMCASGNINAGLYDKANEEIALAATPHLRYHMSWHVVCPIFTQNYIFTADPDTDTCTAVGHHLTEGMKVLLELTSNPPGPGGLANGTMYYVRDVKGDTFRLAAEAGGPAIDITSSGANGDRIKQRISYAWPLLRTRLNDGDHPTAVGWIIYTYRLIKGLGFTTHVSSAAVDAAGKKVTASDQCTVESVAANAFGGVDFTRLDKRLPWAIDEKGRADALFLDPELKGWQDYSLTVTGLPAGTYEVLINDKKVAELTDAQLAAGWNMADLTVGPVWEQCQEVLGRIRDMQGIDRVALQRTGVMQGVEAYKKSANGQYRSGKRGKDMIEALKTQVADIDALDKLVHEAAQPQKLTFSIRLQKNVKND